MEVTLNSDPLEIIRGDTARYKFRRKDKNGETITTIADKIYFTIKKNSTDMEPIIQKTIEDMTFDDGGFYHFILLPSDTDSLTYGMYCYDIERIQDGNKKTIRRGRIKLTSEVTHARNEV